MNTENIITSEVIYEVVKKLTGRINPVGESNEDAERFKNLDVRIELIDMLLSDIKGVSKSFGMYEASVKKIGVKAKKFLEDLEVDVTQHNFDIMDV